MNLNNFVGRSTVAVALVFAAATSSHAQSFTTQQPIYQGGYPSQGNYQTETIVQTPSAEELEKASIGASFFDAGTSTITVSTVFTNSPAQEAGLQTGDMLKKLNGEAIENAQAFTAAVREMNPGDSITVTRFKDGESKDMTIGVAALSEIMKGSMVPEAGAYDNAIARQEQQLNMLRQKIKNAEMDLEDMKKTLTSQEKGVADLKTKAADDKKKAEAMKAKQAEEKAMKAKETEMMKAKEAEMMKADAMNANGSGTR